jgi:hypothetical protein
MIRNLGCQVLAYAALAVLAAPQTLQGVPVDTTIGLSILFRLH